MKLTALKCHGSGNDFLLIDEYTDSLNYSDAERAEMAVRLCDRSEGLGADGILFFQDSKIADGRMRVFNSDGSEASMCGNGLRCVARYACEKLGMKKLRIETMKAVLEVEEMEPLSEGVETYKVEISPVSFRTADLPMKAPNETFINQTLADCSDLPFTAIAVPNPHFIAIVDDADAKKDEQQKLAAYWNGENPYFPDGVNVSFVEALRPQEIFVRTFERGVGFTNACGTAMSASSLVACLQGLASFGEELTVYNPGGKVKCAVHQQEDQYTIDLIGNATYEYKVEMEYQPDGYKVGSRVDFPEEIAAYQQMVNRK
ncbi:diaminopimelate epimerase [Bacillus testis]|uniref:diaminopimelate epimerase n=1 Tax=Bacillus testis TaxID=1622072 RepID=UPI00067F34BB|nr:diaminopimelate epimerase [Bacillus testis]